jgi:hypothetical protein
MAKVCKVAGNVTKNFAIWEMANTLSGEDVELVLTPELIEHAQMMQELRDWYGKPLNVNSWYRTKKFNAKLDGSASNSAHLEGLATDIGNIPKNLYHDFTIAWQVICSIHGKVGGVNYYDTFMHFCSYEDKFGHKTFQVRDYRK